MDFLLKLMNDADFIKCNDEELDEICLALNFSSSSIREQLDFLSQRTQTDKICTTLGKEGAVLLYDNQFYRNNGYPVKVDSP